MIALRKAAVIALILLAACRDATPARTADKAKPELFLLTTLPLIWSEHFGIDQPGSPALKALEEEYRVTPVDLPSRLPTGGLLLAAQPRALPAEELVALDAWVRGGGKLVLLADPMLEWESSLPLGDSRRAPVAFPDTGLLQHWGLRLDAPEERGPQGRGGGLFPLVFISPGNLVTKTPDCSLSRAGITAECKIGNGAATVVADADWLNEELVSTYGGSYGNQAAELLDLISSIRSRR